MKNYTDVIQDTFVDYAGQTHHFTIAAISEVFKEGKGPDIIDVEGLQTETLGSVIKGVKIGISIHNPVDEYNEKAGVCRAIARAEEAEYAILSTSRGYINEKVVRALLDSEANYIKNNPEQYIPGYAEMRDRYLKNQEMENVQKNFSEVERIIVEKLEEDPRFLDNVDKYLAWRANQKKGKCRKGGK